MSESNDTLKPEIASSILELIGNTPLLALDRIWSGPGRILGKCEFLNPTGSLKDRSARFMLVQAKKRGTLLPKSPVIEITSGNHGASVAMCTSIMNHPLTVFMSKGNSKQRAIMMSGLGATVILEDQVEGNYGNVTLADLNAVKSKALEKIEQTKSYFMNQFENPDNVQSHFQSTGPEIWRQSGGRLNAFLTTLGTGGCFTGVSKFLKSKNPSIKCIVVEPEGSQPIEGCSITKPLHVLQGSGYGCVPQLFNFETCDGTISITDEEAIEYRKLLGAKEGIYCGFTSGANVAACVKLLSSKTLPPDSWVVTILCDSGLKY